jgi:hypothetical protein
MQDFSDTYRHLVEKYFRPLGPGDGYSDMAIDSAKSRLKLPLPPVLKEFYRLAGRLEEVNAAHHQLIPLSNWKCIGDQLLFYEENESVVMWSVRAAEPSVYDPPVYQFLPDTEEFIEEGGVLSDFLINMFFVQCLNGGLLHCAMAVVQESIGRQLLSEWESFELLRPPYSEDHLIFTSGKVIASLAPTDSPERSTLTIASQMETEFHAVRKQLPVRWLLQT